MQMVPSISEMKTSKLVIMATNFSDQQLVVDVATRFPSKVIPSFGFHPWFSHLIWDDCDPELRRLAGDQRKHQHYRAVLHPEPSEGIIVLLPDPSPLSSVLNGLRQRLRDFPQALVGEIGMDRGFRIPDPEHEAPNDRSQESRRLSKYKVKMSHQKLIFKAQLSVAGEMQRPVSVHGVACHGAIFDTFKELWKGHEIPVEKNKDIKKRRRKIGQNKYEYISDIADTDSDSGGDPEYLPGARTSTHPAVRYPPRICLHSFSAPMEQLHQYIHQPAPGLRHPSELFFSFSTTINTSPDRGHQNKVSSTIEAVPRECILVESDFHTAGEQQDEALGRALLYVAEARHWKVEETVECLNSNWQRFVYGA